MPPRRQPSPLHTKGVLTLALFVLAETVTFSNAVSFWSKFQKVNDDGFHSKKYPFFATKNQPSDGDCENTQTSQFARRSYPRASSHSKELQCCRDCSHCMDSIHRCRGGGGASILTDTAASAISQYHKIPLNAWKIMFQVFLTAINVACWFLPLKSKHISENKLAMSLANAFSGGVFLSLAFGHLIPECVHGFEAYNEVTPFLLVLAGYLLIFFFEKVAFDTHDVLHEMENASDIVNQMDTIQANGSSTKPARPTIFRHAKANTPPPSSGRSAVILLGALAVHSVLEMMALGLADSFGDCALLTLSIALHQPAESIALLVAFLKSGLNEAQIIRYLSIFSCMGPLGVLLGMLVNEYASPIVDSMMLAIVAGTFVYVGATEVIPEEWDDPKHKWKKFVSLMAGIVSILAITQYTGTLGH